MERVPFVHQVFIKKELLKFWCFDLSASDIKISNFNDLEGASSQLLSMMSHPGLDLGNTKLRKYFTHELSTLITKAFVDMF